MSNAADLYKAEIEKLDTWDKLALFWQDLKNDAVDKNVWPSGKAFEFFILRCFELDGAEVTYPFEVRVFDEILEQIDGAVHYNGLNCIIESKDYNTKVNAVPLAKIRNQLIRRPAATIGGVFVKNDFSAAAITLSYFMFPQTILLWDGADIEYAVSKKSFCKYLYLKYKGAVERGITDVKIIYY